MKKSLSFNLVTVFAISVFACNTFAATEILGFDTMPAAVFENSAFGEGYEEGSYHFGPIDIPGIFSAHIHGEDTDGDSEKELNYHADAGGWFARRIDNGTFNLDSWDMTTLGDQQNDFSNDLIVEGSNGAFLNITQASQPANGQNIDFAGIFDGITSFEVYFDGQKGIIPSTGSAPDGFFASVDNMVLSTEVSQVPVPAAVYLMGTGIIGLFTMRKKQKM